VSGKTQLPELSLSIVGKFYLNGPVSVTVTTPPAWPAPADPCAASESHWKAADSIGTSVAYEDHLTRFPTCAFAGLAKAKLEALKQKSALATPSDTPASHPARTREFDGKWDVTVSCTNSGNARGYTRVLFATVKGGALRAEDQTSGKPNWLLIDGDIAEDGKATLTARGLTGDSVYAVGGAKPGSPYLYTIDAQFEHNRGTGKRNELRPCTVTFAKR
jgi:hypothetical protein